MRRECWERFPRHRPQRNRQLTIPVCIKARAMIHVGIANPRWRGKTFRAFPAYAQPQIVHIWQEAHVVEFDDQAPVDDIYDSLIRLWFSYIK